MFIVVQALCPAVSSRFVSLINSRQEQRAGASTVSAADSALPFGEPSEIKIRRVLHSISS